ncbi:MAG TPA: hypothetical protein VMS21_15305, partial [Methylomirabilota bacterium]|nr:hypothetical protein [Methylomirabilota bacterium]
MKLKRSHHQSGNRVWPIHAFPVSGSIVSMTLGILLATAGIARAQTDDFDDGNDDGWTRFDPLGGLGLPEATFSFPNGGYRLQAPPPPIPDAGPARAFSYLTENSYTEFYAAVDVVDWDDSVDQAFGILGRAGNVGLGETTGYVCNYNPNQTGSRPGGQFQINRVTGEAEDGTLATANITLIPGRSYRMVFIGTGTVMTGHLYDHLDLTAPVATLTVDGTEDDRVLT